MPHQVMGRHLGRDTSHRRALFRNLMTELFRYDRITTTEAKAKSIRAEAEKIITRAKRAEPSRLVQLAQDGNAERLRAMVGAVGADRLLSLAKDGKAGELDKEAAAMALHARRVIMQTIHDKGVVHRLITEIAAAHADRPGGYTRIIKLGPRRGDAAPMVFLEIVE